MMEDKWIIQAVERYLKGTMLPSEKSYFEQLRKNTPEIDQMVTEYEFFYKKLDQYAEISEYKDKLNFVHSELEDRDLLSERENSGKARVIYLYKKYRKVVAIAACVGGLIAMIISGAVNYISPSNNSQLQELKREFEVVRRNQQYQGHKINEFESKLPKGAVITGGGSAFMIDTKGYLITNAHVLKGSSFANVLSSRGKEYKAKILCIDDDLDLALLKIDDPDYFPVKVIPYGIRRGEMDLGEEVFTLGYPRNDITYNKGDVSAKTGFNGDSTRLQIEMNANPGNSGGPVLDRAGNIVGVLSTRETRAEGVTFAIKSRNIYKFIDEVKFKNRTSKEIDRIHLTGKSKVTDLDRTDLVKAVQNYVFLVQAFN